MGGQHRGILRGISIHALREEGDPRKWRSVTPCRKFLSTPSARRATLPPRCRCSPAGNFYPRPPRGGRQIAVYVVPMEIDISIHALREEGDLCTPCRRYAGRAISIHALREEGDLCGVLGFHGLGISIHALREEGDGAAPHGKQSGRNFYPRPPRGGRLLIVGDVNIQFPISIHALREEGDAARRVSSLAVYDFYPRPPRGGRRVG